MPRSKRIQFPGAFFHVMNRGSAHSPIFLDDRDRLVFLNIVGESHIRFALKVHAYHLMPNHYHLLLETPRGNLSQSLQRIDGLYTQYFNKKHGRDGALLRGRFKSILVDKDTYLLQLMRYIHLNGISADLARDPEDDPYSSHACYTGKRVCPNWLCTDLVLEMFSADHATAVDKLKAFVAAGMPGDKVQSIRSRRPVSEPLTPGDIRAMITEQTTTLSSDPEQQDALPRSSLEPERILEGIAKFYGTDRESFTKPSGAKKNKPRQMAVFLLRKVNGLTFEKIAEICGISRGGAASIYRHLFAEVGKESQQVLQLTNHTSGSDPDV